MEGWMSALTLSKKAGKLILGFDVVKEAIEDDTVCLVLLAEDLSPKSKKEMAFICEKYRVEIRSLPIKMDEIWYLLSKRSGIIAVTDAGLADKIRSAL